MAGTESERRHVARRAVHAPLALSNGTFGTTTDVSATGVRFLSGGPDLSKGESVTFVLKLEHEDIILHCAGEVVRVDRSNGRTYVAATIRNVEFDVHGTSH